MSLTRRNSTQPHRVPPLGQDWNAPTATATCRPSSPARPDQALPPPPLRHGRAVQADQRPEQPIPLPPHLRRSMRAAITNARGLGGDGLSTCVVYLGDLRVIGMDPKSTRAAVRLAKRRARRDLWPDGRRRRVSRTPSCALAAEAGRIPSVVLSTPASRPARRWRGRRCSYRRVSLSRLDGSRR